MKMKEKISYTQMYVSTRSRDIIRFFGLQFFFFAFLFILTIITMLSENAKRGKMPNRKFI